MDNTTQREAINKVHLLILNPPTLLLFKVLVFKDFERQLKLIKFAYFTFLNVEIRTVYLLNKIWNFVYSGEKNGIGYWISKNYIQQRISWRPVQRSMT